MVSRYFIIEWNFMDNVVIAHIGKHPPEGKDEEWSVVEAIKRRRIPPGRGWS
jgi:hypothetical protein